MKRVLIIGAFIVSASAQATIMGFSELAANFTNAASAITNVTWSEPEKITVSTNGLGWDGEPNASRDFWIQSIPVAIGTSWRPAQGANVVVEIAPQPKPVTLPNGQSWTPYGGQVFVRYSPDKKHWTSWQALERQNETGTNQIFRGLIQVPQTEREKYGKLVSEYSTLDVDWKSDEEAVVKWILQREHDFFEKQLPFVGYVEFRMEGSLPGGQRIQRIKMKLSWAVGGLHSIPKNPEAEKTRSSAWSFEAP